MTREEAKEMFYIADGYDVIDKIYDDFENKTCEWEKTMNMKRVMFGILIVN